MSEIDWSRIVKQQDKYVHESDKIQQERRIRLKQLYKTQLLNMIHQNQNKFQSDRENDRKLIQFINEKQRIRLQSQANQQKKKQAIRQQLARQNLKSVENKRQKNRSQDEQFSKFYLSKYKKMMVEDNKQNKSFNQRRQHTRQQLAKAYESQINQHSNKKFLEKLQDQKFTKLREQIQEKKQENRKKFFEKLRNGYGQNPEVFQLCKTLAGEKESRRINFINKLATEQQRQLSLDKIKQQKNKNKNKQIIQVSKFNKIYFQTKAKKERLETLQQTTQYHLKNRTLQQQLQQERQKMLKAKEENRKILKTQLEHQINQSQLKNNQKFRLNQVEGKLNKSGHIAYLPGIVKDNSVDKHQRILQNFLGRRSSKSIDYSY